MPFFKDPPYRICMSARFRLLQLGQGLPVWITELYFRPSPLPNNRSTPPCLRCTTLIHAPNTTTELSPPQKPIPIGSLCLPIG